MSRSVMHGNPRFRVSRLITIGALLLLLSGCATLDFTQDPRCDRVMGEAHLTDVTWESLKDQQAYRLWQCHEFYKPTVLEPETWTEG